MAPRAPRVALSITRMAQSSASLRHTRRRRRRRHRSPHGHPPRPLRLRSRPHLGRPSIVASWRRAGARRARASVARWPPPSTAARARRASAKAGRAVVGYGFTRAVLGLRGAGRGEQVQGRGARGLEVRSGAPGAMHAKRGPPTSCRRSGNPNPNPNRSGRGSTRTSTRSRRAMRRSPPSRVTSAATQRRAR